jgi:hypothetical protein
MAQNGQDEEGYLLYLKSSFTGDESEAIREYRHRNPTFPHQTTADQSFDEGQFEAYRALGQHIAELALNCKHEVERPGEKLRSEAPAKKMSFKDFKDFEDWFGRLLKTREEPKPTAAAAQSQHGTRKTEASTYLRKRPT